MLKTILVLVVVLVIVLIGVLGYAATRPSTFHVERSATMAAPASEVFAQVNDFHKWDAWSPWDKMDPDMKRTYEGAESGKGAVYMWAGNSNVGEGKMTITDVAPDDRIAIKLEFYKPMAGVSTAEFTFKPEGDGTRVTWSMDGTNGFVGKVFSLFMDMDTMIGGNFEQGLAALKKIVEAAPAQ